MAFVSFPIPDKVYPESIHPSDSPAVIDYGPEYLRRLLGAVFPVDGVVTWSDLNMAQTGTGGKSIDIGVGGAIVKSTSKPSERYFFYNTASVTVDISSFTWPPAATRVHKVYLACYDKAAGVGSYYGARIFVAEDTGAGAGVPSDNPIGYLYLGTITVASGQTSITNAMIKNLPSVAGRTQTWVTLANNLASGWATGTFTPQYQKIGNTVRLRGGVVRSTDIAAGQNIVVSPLPTLITPAASRISYHAIAMQWGNNNDLALARLAVDGSDNTIKVWVSTAATGTGVRNIFLDSVTYDV
jgi:hypothetical protein